MKFVPNQPSSEVNPDLCRVSHYHIQSRIKNREEWVNVFSKELDPNEVLSMEESVDVPQHLLSERKYCEYQITMHYDAGDVKSSVFSSENPVDPIGKNAH